MKTLKTTLILVLLLAISFINAQEKKLNINKSSINWTGKAAFSSFSFTGNLKTKSGKISIENDSIIDLEVLVDMKSLHHDNKKLKKHLRNKDFFEVKKYTSALFKLEKPVKIENNSTILVGYFTIKKTKLKETITAKVYRKNNEISLNFKTQIDRTKYGVTYNSPSIFEKIKQNAIADKFTLTCNLVLD